MRHVRSHKSGIGLALRIWTALGLGTLPMLAVPPVHASDWSWLNIASMRIGEVAIQRGSLSLHTEAINIASHGSELQADVASIEIRDRNGQGVNSPLDARASWQPNGDFSAELIDRSSTIEFRAREMNGRRAFALKQIDFGSGGADFAKLFPGFGAHVRKFGGAIAFSAQGPIGGPMSALVTAQDLEFEAFGARMHGLDAKWEVTNLWPLTTASTQKASLKRFDLGEISGSMNLAFSANGRQLIVPEFEMLVGQSAFGASDLAIDLSNGQAMGELLIDGFEMSEFVKPMALDGLDVTGWLVGSVPFEVAWPGQVRLKNGQLSSVTPGIVRYRPKVPPAALAGSNAGLALARQALENFYYRSLQLRLDGDFGGAMSIGLTLEGSNPDLHGGHPLEFNLNLDGALALLVQKAVEAYRLPTAFREKLLDLL